MGRSSTFSCNLILCAELDYIDSLQTRYERLAATYLQSGLEAKESPLEVVRVPQ